METEGQSRAQSGEDPGSDCRLWKRMKHGPRNPGESSGWRRQRHRSFPRACKSIAALPAPVRPSVHEMLLARILEWIAIPFWAGEQQDTKCELFETNTHGGGLGAWGQFKVHVQLREGWQGQGSDKVCIAAAPRPIPDRMLRGHSCSSSRKINNERRQLIWSRNKCNQTSLKGKMKLFLICSIVGDLTYIWVSW